MSFIRNCIVLVSAALVTACGGGGGGSSPPATPTPTPTPDAAVGGAWIGTDGGGQTVFGLSTDDGRLHWVVPDTGEQGFGTVSSNGTTLSANYTYVAPFGFTLDDGSTFATCTATGTIQERQSISANISCTTGNGGNFANTATLAYDALYERDASLATLAGDYDDFGLVLSIDANGNIFEQDPFSGCVVTGQASVVDPNYNVYDGSVTYANCQGDAAVLNGSTFIGLGILDDTVVPETLVVGMVGDVVGVTYSVIYILPRL
jgi:hypothetical protein